MIRGPILRVVASLTFPFSVLLTLYFLVSGHNNPGGGFIAGVLMSGAIALQFIAHGPEGVPRLLKLPYERIVALGFVIAIIAATAPLVAGYPFLTSFHATLDVPVLGAKMEFALAQLFDFGIFLLVAAGVMTAVLALAQDDEDEKEESPSDGKTADPEVTGDDEPENVAEADNEDVVAEADADESITTQEPVEQEPMKSDRSIVSVEGGK